MNEFNYENAVALAEIRRTPNMSFDSRVISVHSITERVGGGDRYRGASKAEIPETGILPKKGRQESSQFHFTPEGHRLGYHRPTPSCGQLRKQLKR